ncbi:MAG: hypothetical protein AAF558_04525 [Verrucomicrobiota bacterium]
MTFLAECQGVLEKIYRPAGVNLERCVIGPNRFSDLVRDSGIDPNQFSGRAFTFLRPDRRQLRMALYYDPEIIKVLEHEDPRLSISHRNVAELIDFTEEITHGVHSALAFSDGVRAFEAESFACALEIQAKVDVYLMILRALKALVGDELGEDAVQWLKAQVLDGYGYSEMPFILARRYRMAVEIAGRFIEALFQLEAKQRLEWLRKFRQGGVWWKWKTMRSLEKTVIKNQPSSGFFLRSCAK